MVASSCGPAGTFEVNQQRQRRVTGKFASPPDDERLGPRVQVALAERRRIDRVEELSQFGDADFDDGGRRRSDITGRRPGGRHGASWLEKL